MIIVKEKNSNTNTKYTKEMNLRFLLIFYLVIAIFMSFITIAFTKKYFRELYKQIAILNVGLMTLK